MEHQCGNSDCCTMLWLCTSLVLCASINGVFGANILAITPVSSHSHHIWHRSLFLELIRQGHNITYLGPDAEKSVTPNLTGIVFKDIYETLYGQFPLQDLVKFSSLDTANMVFEWIHSQCELCLHSDVLETLMNYPSDTFDLIIVDLMSSECFLPIIAKFGNPPLVGTSPFGLLPWMNHIAGGYTYASFIPNYTTLYTDRMAFTERFVNFIMDAYTQLYFTYVHMPRMESLVAERFGPQRSSLISVYKSISVSLVNYDAEVNEPVPLPPTIIPTSGVHINTPKALPKDLQVFMDEAKEGVILFALGSNIQPNMLSAKRIQILIEAFGKLPQKVIWKWETDELPIPKPPNVLIKKWLPQTDILAHPNLKLFFTHAGALSTQESIMRGVPVVGMPFFLDQFFNMNKLAKRGFGLALSYEKLSVQKVIDTITTVINNPIYRENIQEASRRYRDQPLKPMEKAMYWINYVLRNGGAHHLQPAAIHMPMYQTCSLDVLAVLILVPVAVVMSFCKIIRLCLKGKNTKVKQQ